MNGTIIKEETLKEMKELSKRIEAIEIEMFIDGYQDNLVLELKQKSLRLTEIILAL